MKQQRRELDRCLMKRLYDSFTPYIQLSGCVAILVPMVLLLNDARAYGDRLSTVETKYNMTANDVKIIDQKLDLIIRFLQIQKEK